MKTRLRTICYLVAFLLGLSAYAQDPYQVMVERPNEKSLKGIISRQVLLKDSSFHWYQENLRGYTPNASALEALKTGADSLQFIVFMGTWCDDSQFIIPKFFSLLDAASIPDSKVSLLGVDRKKFTLGNLSEAFRITNVPTILVMKNGKEIGRVVEYGKYGVFDKELGEIINSAHPR